MVINLGLDNGIDLHIKNVENYQKAYKLFKHEEWYKPGEVEVCYWRKCYCIRNAILRVVDTQVTNEYEYPVTLDNIDDIIKSFKYFLHKHEWEYEADTIWEWDKWTRRNQARNLIGLYRLKHWLKKHPEDTAYFYDSY